MLIRVLGRTDFACSMLDKYRSDSEARNDIVAAGIDVLVRYIGVTLHMIRSKSCVMANTAMATCLIV